MLLDSKLVKLSDEVVLLYLAGVWTGHGKEVLVVVMLMLLLLLLLKTSPLLPSESKSHSMQFPMISN